MGAINVYTFILQQFSDMYLTNWVAFPFWGDKNKLHKPLCLGKTCTSDEVDFHQPDCYFYRRLSIQQKPHEDEKT